MAVGFRRRLATLTVPRAASIRRTRHRKLSYTRTRSASLPGRFHLVVAGLHDSANALLGWTEAPGSGPSRQGVDRRRRTAPGTAPRRSSKTTAPWTEWLLDDFLNLADAHGCFREALLSLKQLLDEAHAAVRRSDAPRLAAALRARRRSDAPRLASAAIFAGLASASASSACIGISHIGFISRRECRGSAGVVGGRPPAVAPANGVRRRCMRVLRIARQAGSSKETPPEECCHEEEYV
ncbi:hypothetical protein ACQ4PT_014348 [Festuca glaucescens]